MKVRGGAARRKGEAELPHQESHHPCRASAREHNTAPAIFKSALRRLAQELEWLAAHIGAQCRQVRHARAGAENEARSLKARARADHQARRILQEEVLVRRTGVGSRRRTVGVLPGERVHPAALR